MGGGVGAGPCRVEEESPRAMASPSQRRFGVLRGSPVGSGHRAPSVVAPPAVAALSGPTSLYAPSQLGLSVLSASHCSSATPVPAARTQPDLHVSPFGRRDVVPAGGNGWGAPADGRRASHRGYSPRLQLLQRRATTSVQLLRHTAGSLLSAVEVTAGEARAIAASSLALHLVGVDVATQAVVAVLLEPPPVGARSSAGGAASGAAAAALRVGSEVPGLAAGDRVAVVCPPLLAALSAEAVAVGPASGLRVRVPPPAGVVLPSALPGGAGRRLRVAGVVLGLDYVPLDRADPLLSEGAVSLSSRLALGDVDALFPRRSGAGGGGEQSWASAVIRRFSSAEHLLAPRVTLAVKVVRVLASRRALVEDDSGQLGLVIVRCLLWWSLR